MTRSLLVAVVALSACTDLDDAFVCTTDSECASTTGPGRCEPTRACSFPDGQCGSGRRYGALDGKGLANRCTDAVDLGGDDLAAQTDGAPSMTIPHLAGTQAGGTGALAFAASTTDLLPVYSVDTTTLTINGAAPPAGTVFDVDHEATSGAELAVLRVDTLLVESGVVVTVTGSRGLVVVASGDVMLAGVLDASAHVTGPGPGGFGPGAGLGAGRTRSSDLAASGAGYGTTGGPGLQADQTDAGVAAGGASYGDAPITILLGGSGGGSGASPTVGGAGGGAIQVTSATTIDVEAGGGINAGGGGAPGGVDFADSGGGSGGSIFLSAPSVRISGTLAANGGGGSCGGVAQDGVLSTNPAIGGIYFDCQGGAGGARYALPSGGYGGQFHASGGAGGGGAVGRIAITYGQTFIDLGTYSPAPITMQR